MKVIGPYVISATPLGAIAGGYSDPQEPGRAAASTASSAGPGAAPSANTPLPLHGIDRLTGMPVLLHRLTQFVVPAPLPESDHLLPVSEVDVWDGHPYAVSELPPAAVPATHPATAALGVLRALNVLHRAGQVHGGLNAGQFWQVGRDVRLAGAGLPWQPGAAPASDLRALALALDTLGPRPAVLRDLEQMTAGQALAALEAAMAAAPGRTRAPERSAPDVPVAPPPPDQPSLGPPRDAPAPAALPTDAETVPERPVIAAAPAVSSAPASLGSPEPAAAPLPGRAAPTTPRPFPEPEKPRKTLSKKERNVASRAAAPVAAPAERPPHVPLPFQALPETVTSQTDLDPGTGTPVPEVPPAATLQPAAQPYRSATDIIVIGDAPAASPDLAPAPRTAPEAADPVVRLVPAPIQIGFDDLPELPDDWTAKTTPTEASPPAEGTSDAALQDAQSRPVTEGAASAPAPVPAATEEAAPSALEDPQSVQPGTAAGRTVRYAPVSARSENVRGQALRIGWEEDHSWRVVKSVPERRSRTRTRLPTSTWAGVLLALLVLAGVAFWTLGRTGTPAAACCTQTFKVAGSQLPVEVRLVQAPPGSPLQAGAVIGTAPGQLKFPGAPGRYTLRFSAAGHGALTGAVTVPSDQPFTITLK